MSSPFKQQLQKDLATFLNEDEFAEMHTIDGIEIPVVIDNDAMRERADKSGLDYDDLLIFVRKNDLPSVPIVQKSMRFDKKFMTIMTVIEDGDMYEITLTQNRSG